MSETQFIPQAAAIPFRFDEMGSLEVLLTLREGRSKWGIPKGLIDPGETACQTAVKESIEEAGIAGRISAEPVASFTFDKWGGTCCVAVYLLEVTDEYANYLERRERHREWFSLDESLTLTTRPAITAMLCSLPAMIRSQSPCTADACS